MNNEEISNLFSKIKLKQTCFACPEQYDAFLYDRKVGYLRLRHGYFRVDFYSGETIYEANPEGDGSFNSDERDYYLIEAKMAIAKRIFMEEEKNNT